MPGNEEERRLVVKQSYPFKTSGRQSSENARRLPMEEHSRTIVSDGTVVKFMEDNSVQVCTSTLQLLFTVDKLERLVSFKSVTNLYGQ